MSEYEGEFEYLWFMAFIFVLAASASNSGLLDGETTQNTFCVVSASWIMDVLMTLEQSYMKAFHK